MPRQTNRRGFAGAPRKADNRSGSSTAFAAAVALELPKAVRSRRGGVVSFSVDGHVFLRLDGEGMAEVREGDGSPIDIELHRTPRDDVRSLVESAWRHHAPKGAAAALTGARKRYGSPVTVEEVRAMALALPGASEGPIWGSMPGFMVLGEKRRRFARFGPPVSNLLAPDDEDTLLIFQCEHKPLLLADSADRFFSTPHYGDPEEPGTVITRLSENTSEEHREELAELLEDSWRHVATDTLIAELEARSD